MRLALFTADANSVTPRCPFLETAGVTVEVATADAHGEDFDGWLMPLTSVKNSAVADPWFVWCDGPASHSIPITVWDQGAIGLVRGDRAEEDLAAVRRIIGWWQQAGGETPPSPSLLHAEWCYELANQPALAEQICQSILGDLQRTGGFPRREAVRATAAIYEAVDNAIQSGNLEVSPNLRRSGRAYADLLKQRQAQSPYRERHVQLSLRLTSATAECLVRQDGPGFDSARWFRTGGQAETGLSRGMTFLRAFAQEVGYNSAGTEIRLTFCRDRS